VNQSHQNVQIGASTRAGAISRTVLSPCPPHSVQKAECSAAIFSATSSVRGGRWTSSRISAPGPMARSRAPNRFSQDRRMAPIHTVYPLGDCPDDIEQAIAAFPGSLQAEKLVDPRCLPVHRLFVVIVIELAFPAGGQELRRIQRVQLCDVTWFHEQVVDVVFIIVQHDRHQASFAVQIGQRPTTRVRDREPYAWSPMRPARRDRTG
jgi:hypothetical protein